MDADERALRAAGALAAGALPAGTLDSLAAAPIPASAPQPKEDRRIIRSEAMQALVSAAERIRAPKTGKHPASPCLATEK